MIRNLCLVLMALVAFTACNRTYEKALKSKDPAFKLKAANELYENEKWAYAVELYQDVAKNYVGTDSAELIAYRSAYANFYDKNYPLAASQFRNFHLAYPRDERAEEALFMSAFAYYQGSPKYNLDQTNTYNAIRELQGFIDTYPTSERVLDANKYINELQEKLEKKYFEIAKSYFKTIKYKSATVAFANFIDDFPDSKYREEAYMYLFKSRAELAINSTLDKKKNRLDDAKTAYRIFHKLYPESEFTDEAEKLLNQVKEEETKHEQLLKRIEAKS